MIGLFKSNRVFRNHPFKYIVAQSFVQKLKRHPTIPKTEQSRHNQKPGFYLKRTNNHMIIYRRIGLGSGESCHQPLDEKWMNIRMRCTGSIPF